MEGLGWGTAACLYTVYPGQDEARTWPGRVTRRKQHRPGLLILQWQCLFDGFVATLGDCVSLAGKVATRSACRLHGSWWSASDGGGRIETRVPIPPDGHGHGKAVIARSVSSNEGRFGGYPQRWPYLQGQSVERSKLTVSRHRGPAFKLASRPMRRAAAGCARGVLPTGM